MSKIELGNWLGGRASANADLKHLLASRLLLQAGSGFGKSWALRRILEQTAGAVQQFVIDPEGEFATLREKHDYVIAAVQGGDALIHPRTAALLCRRLMETGVSAVLDISELRKPERRRCVRLFLEELMQLPRELWSPLLVVIDEAHEFAPEKDEAESLGAVVDLATRGRKRGFALLAATQRIGKFSKDAAAELHNKLIGFTSLDIDVKRAAFELGLTPSDAMKVLRELAPGDFYAYGPAMAKQLRALHIGGVETTHPEPGKKKFRAPPKPTAAIKAVLPKLADLPKEADQEARTIEELRREMTQLKRELTQARKAQPATAAPAIDNKALQAAAREQKRLRAAIEELMKFIIKVNTIGFEKGAGVDAAALTKAVEAAVGQAVKLIDANLAGRQKALESLQRDGGRLIAQVQKLLAEQKVEINLDVQKQAPFAVSSKGNGLAKSPPIPKVTPTTEGLTVPQQKLLNKLAWLEAHGISPARKETLAAVAGVSPTSGGYFNNLGALRNKLGLIDYPTPGEVAFTEAGRAAAQAENDDRPVHEHWLDVVTAPQRKILEALIARHPEPISKDSLAETINVSPTSGGYFNNLGRLRTWGAIDYPQQGFVALTRHVMPEGLQ